MAYFKDKNDGTYIADKAFCDWVEITKAEYDVLNPVPIPTFEQIVTSFENAIQQHLDNEAKLKGYDNITNACSYAGAPNPFQTEAQSFITWRGNVWAYCYGELAKVQAGTRPMPTIYQIISELPAR